MTTQASPDDLLKQADSFTAAADALSPKIADSTISFDERRQLLEDSQALRSQAFKLRTLAAQGKAQELANDVAAMQVVIDKGRKVLQTIKNIKLAIEIVTDLLQLATAIASGKPQTIAAPLEELKKDIEATKEKV